MLEKALHILDMTTPESIILEVVTLPPTLDRKKTARETRKDPKKPQKAMFVLARKPVNTEEAPTIIEKVAPKEAPEDRPRI